jgi:AcrR family transcriptional regulator
MSSQQPSEPGSSRRGDQRLPPGRHGLEREEVIAHQRRRLLAATADAVVEVGYGALTVAEITKRARVSRVTFYQLFDGKSAILAATFDQAFVRLRSEIEMSCRGAGEWPEGVLAGVRAAITFALSNPSEAALLTLDAIGIEPALSDRVRRANAALAELLSAGRPKRRSQPLAGEDLPDFIEMTLIAGATSMIGSQLAVASAETLISAAPQLAQLLLSPYLGSAEAAAAIDRAGLDPT